MVHLNKTCFLHFNLLDDGGTHWGEYGMSLELTCQWEDCL